MTVYVQVKRHTSVLVVFEWLLTGKMAPVAPEKGGAKALARSNVLL